MWLDWIPGAGLALGVFTVFAYQVAETHLRRLEGTAVWGFPPFLIQSDLLAYADEKARATTAPATSSERSGQREMRFAPKPRGADDLGDPAHHPFRCHR